MQRFVFRNFERILVLLLVASLLGINWLVEQKFAFLSFYYLPIILAGFYGGGPVSPFVGVFIPALLFFFSASPRNGRGARVEAGSAEVPVPLGGLFLFHRSRGWWT